MLKIGIIDSGIGATAGLPIHAARDFFWRNGKIISCDTEVPDQLGHGSALAEIILQQSPHISLLIAKVFFYQLVCTPAQIAAALDWQITSGATLINMSFGLHSDRAILKEACQRALHAGAILVAASPARGAPVYPAAYPGVIRATGDARCHKGEVSYLNSGQADFGGHVRANQQKIAGASVGCAYITASIATILLAQPQLKPLEIIDRLVAQAKYLGTENRCLESRNQCDEG